LVALDQNSNLKERLAGERFYLVGTTNLSGLYNFNEKGVLTHGNGDMEKTVYVWEGPNPLSLIVLNDDHAHQLGRRFAIAACDAPSYVASVIVGIRISAFLEQLRA
jgi:hypothetical protein